MSSLACMCPYSPHDAHAAGEQIPSPSQPQQHRRRPGRPPTYVFSRPDHELSENERRLKGSVIKRRIRQNRSYHRKKQLRQLKAAEAHTADRDATNADRDATNADRDATNADRDATNTDRDATNADRDATIAHTASRDCNFQFTPASAPDYSSHVFTPPTAPLPPEPHVPSLPADPLNAALLQNPRPPIPSLSFLPSVPPLNPAPFSSSAAFNETPAVMLPASPSQHLPQMYNSSSHQHIPTEAELDISNRRSLSNSNTMVRSAANRPVLAAQLSTRMAALSIDDSCLSKLLIFPSTFDAPSALAVLNARLDDAPALLSSLVDTNLLSVQPGGRYVMNPIARELLAEHQAWNQPDVQTTFVHNFAQKLLSFGPERLHCDGAQRQVAMKLYDQERANMNIALQLSQSLHTPTEPLLFHFLSVAATVMRYSVPASARVQIFCSALRLPCPATSRRVQARLRLALGEAYLDMLSLSSAKQHLEAAIADLAMHQSSNDSDLSNMLALLLLAELRASEREFEHAKNLLHQVLQSMHNRSMKRSSYAACCLLTLASVYSAMHEEGKALCAVTTAIDVLVAVKFERMPIYADALRVLGCVHLRMGDVDKGQKAFLEGLQIVRDWNARPDWDHAPFQHCTHLDVFLFESLAWTFVKQDRMGDAEALFGHAKSLRRMRNLDETRSVNPFEDAPHPGGPSRGDGSHTTWLYTRHLY